MNHKNQKNPNGKKSRKKIYSFVLNESSINAFDNKIGLVKRSPIIQYLIDNFVNKKSGKDTHSLPLGFKEKTPMAKKEICS